MMQFSAKLRYVRFSPYKLRPLADIVRGKDAQFALDWLSIYAVKCARPIKKMIQSAIANAHNLKNMQAENLVIVDLRVDEGPMYRYYKPGAMGRATVLRKRSSHVSVILRPKRKLKQDKIEKA